MGPFLKRQRAMPVVMAGIPAAVSDYEAENCNLGMLLLRTVQMPP